MSSINYYDDECESSIAASLERLASKEVFLIPYQSKNIYLSAFV